MSISKCDEPHHNSFFFFGQHSTSPNFLDKYTFLQHILLFSPISEISIQSAAAAAPATKIFLLCNNQVISSIGVMSLKPSTIASPSTFATVRPDEGWWTQIMHIGSGPIGLNPMCHVQYRPLEKRTLIKYAIRAKQTSVICAATLNATCAGEQTQTVTRQSSTLTVAPVQGKEKSPELDDGGTGFPPRDDGDGGGGGGGGGGNWSGGFFFFGFLAFLGFLKDKENEGPYRDDRR